MLLQTPRGRKRGPASCERGQDLALRYRLPNTCQFGRPGLLECDRSVFGGKPIDDVDAIGVWFGDVMLSLRGDRC